MKSRLYRITFLLKGNDEQVMEAYGTSTFEAIQNALYRINHDDLVEYMELKKGALFGETGEIFEELPEGRKWLSGMFYTRNEGRIFLPDFVVSVDEVETQQAIVKVRRGDDIEFVTPHPAGRVYRKAVAWFEFENQHGKGWSMLNQYDQTKVCDAYCYEITQVNGVAVEYNPFIGSLVELEAKPVQGGKA